VTCDKGMFVKLRDTHPAHFRFQRGVRNRRMAPVFSASPFLTLPELIDERISKVRFALELSFAVVFVEPSPTECLTLYLLPYLFLTKRRGLGIALIFVMIDVICFFLLSSQKYRRDKQTVYDITRMRSKVPYGLLSFLLTKEYPE